METVKLLTLFVFESLQNIEIANQSYNNLTLWYRNIFNIQLNSNLEIFRKFIK